MKQRFSSLLVLYVISSFGIGALYAFRFEENKTNAVIAKSQTVETKESQSSKTDKEKPKKSVDELWSEVTKIDACFTGTDSYEADLEKVYSDYNKTPRPISDMTQVLYKDVWYELIHHNKKESVPFLIKQFSDKGETRLHLCPYNNAQKGELAVIALQHILKVNWYELKDEYKTRVDNLKTGNDQQLLRTILSTKNGLKEMQDLWLKKLETTLASES